uniref:Uncharacterized protein n=1 Tax=Theileria annulata TaxID=5874 RepID=A0A3B0MGF7_THEAN
MDGAQAGYRNPAIAAAPLLQCVGRRGRCVEVRSPVLSASLTACEETLVRSAKGNRANIPEPGRGYWVATQVNFSTQAWVPESVLFAF